MTRNSELSSEMYCRVKWLSIDVSEVHTASIIRDETSDDNHFTRQYIPEDNSEHHTRRRENLKSHKWQETVWHHSVYHCNKPQHLFGAYATVSKIVHKFWKLAWLQDGGGKSRACPWASTDSSDHNALVQRTCTTHYEIPPIWEYFNCESKHSRCRTKRNWHNECNPVLSPWLTLLHTRCSADRTHKLEHGRQNVMHCLHYQSFVCSKTPRSYPPNPDTWTG
jgi:hypothetical protein